MRKLVQNWYSWEVLKTVFYFAFDCLIDWLVELFIDLSTSTLNEYGFARTKCTGIDAEVSRSTEKGP